MGLEQLSIIETSRGALAAWLLIGFGLAYTAWAIVRSRRDHHHSHAHAHADGTVHDHSHDHHEEHLHAHDRDVRSLTAWSLFVIFVLGPCEPLIPLLMAPAAELGVGAAVAVAAVFGLTTIGTMLVAVTVGYVGLGLRRFDRLERHAHTLAGLAIVTSGLAIQLLGV